MVFGIGKRRQARVLADKLYSRIVSASRQEAFFTDFAVPDTLDGRFEMLSLHMYLGIDRLNDGSEQEVRMAQAVMESFVRDMDASLRDLGVSDLRVPKRMKALYGSFGGRIGGYRLARGEGGDAMHSALARNIYTDGGDERTVRRLGAYVTDALAEIARIPADALANGRIEFPDARRYAPRPVPQGK